MLLDVAFSFSDGGSQDPELPVVHPGAYDAHDHKCNEHPQEVRGKGHEINRCGKELENGNHHARDPFAQKLGDHPCVLLQAVHRVTGEELLLAVPGGVHHLAEDIQPDPVLRILYHILHPPGVENEEAYLGCHDNGHVDDVGLEGSVAVVRYDVDEGLALHHEKKRHRNAHNPGEYADEDLAPEGPEHLGEAHHAGLQACHPGYGRRGGNGGGVVLSWHVM